MADTQTHRFRLSRVLILLGLALGLATLVLLVLSGRQPAYSDSSCQHEAERAVAEHSEAQADGSTLLQHAVVEVCGVSLSVALISDLLFLAEDRNADFLTVLMESRPESAFVAAVQELMASFPDEFAGAEYVRRGRSWVAFKGEVPARARALLTGLDTDIIAGRGFSGAEVNEALVSAFTTINQAEGVDGSSGGFDPETGVISIAVYTSNPDQVRSKEAEWRASNPLFTLVVTLLAEPPLGGPDGYRGE